MMNTSEGAQEGTRITPQTTGAPTPLTDIPGLSAGLAAIAQGSLDGRPLPLTEAEEDAFAEITALAVEAADAITSAAPPTTGEHEAEQARGLDITNLMDTVHGRINQTFAGDALRHLCVVDGIDGPVLYFARNGWWAAAAPIEIAQELRRIFVPEIDNATGMIQYLIKSLTNPNLTEKGEQENTARLAVERGYLKAIKRLVNWSPAAKADTAMLHVLPALQRPPFLTDGVRCGDLWIDTASLAELVPVRADDHRTGGRGCPMAPATLKDNSGGERPLTWQDCGPWFEFLSQHFYNPTNDLWRSFTEIIGWSVFYGEAGTKMWVHLIGLSNGGKSFWNDTLLPMLMDVAVVTNAGLAGTDQFGLAGLAERPNARAIRSEGETQGNLSTEIIKRLTSAQEVSIRSMRLAPRGFRFRGSLFTDSNTPPTFTIDSGLRARLVVIPMPNPFTTLPADNLIEQYRQYAPRALRMFFEAYKGLHGRAKANGTKLLLALDLPAEFQAATADMERESSEFLAVCDWLSTDRSIEGHLVPQADFHRLIGRLDKTVRGTRGEFGARKIKPALAGTGRADYERITADGATTWKMKVNGTAQDAVRIFPMFTEDTTSLADVLEALNSLLQEEHVTERTRASLIVIAKAVGLTVTEPSLDAAA